jgi:hypothetical protein
MESVVSTSGCIHIYFLELPAGMYLDMLLYIYPTPEIDKLRLFREVFDEIFNIILHTFNCRNKKMLFIYLLL